MGAWVPEGTREPQERLETGAEADEREPVRLPPSPYSDQYETMLAQERGRPAPAFGTPALVWHVAIWPRRTLQGANGDTEACDPHDTTGERPGTARETFETRRRLWLEQINLFLKDLQAHCRRKAAAPRQFNPVAPHDLHRRPPDGDADPLVAPIQVLEEEIVPFTLWWGEPGAQSAPQGAGAQDADAIRVRVHPEVNADFAAISFYMDIGPAAAGDPSIGRRRGRLLAAVDDIRRICDAQLDPAMPGGTAAVDRPAPPETLHSPDGRTPDELREALKTHRNLLYVDIWEAFSQEMDCRLEDIAGDRGEVFANFRGLVMSTDGLQAVSATPLDTPLDTPRGARSAAMGAHRPFGADGVEPNAVVAAYWPLVRRITPRADSGDLVACGVLDWRAIFMSAPGVPGQSALHQEGEPLPAEEGEAAIRVPGHLLADDEKHLAAVAGPFDSQVRKRAGPRSGNNHPVRYLLLTRHEPLPRQIGRIAERINAMGTMRLYALKDWAAVRNADPYLRIFGQDLDRITGQWRADRRLIDRLGNLRTARRAAREVRRYERRLRAAYSEEERQQILRHYRGRYGWTGAELDRLRIALPRFIPASPAPLVVRLLLRAFYIFRWRRYGDLMESMENDRMADLRHAALYELSRRAESELVDISAGLDELGFGAVGGLHFRLGRSAHYIREFHAVLETLRIGDIPTRTSYRQLVEHGLAPAFDYMKGVGERLHAVRERLRIVTETIQTGALLGQSAATHHHTAVLRRATTLLLLLVLLLLAIGADQVMGLMTGVAELAGRLLSG